MNKIIITIILILTILISGCSENEVCQNYYTKERINVTYIDGLGNYTCFQLKQFLDYDIQPELISTGTEVHYNYYYTNGSCVYGEIHRNWYKETGKTSKEAIFNYWIKECQENGRP